MKRKAVCALALIIALSLAACGGYAGSEPEGYAQLDRPQAGDIVAVFSTSKGTFKAVLFPEYAPQNVQNFISLAEAGYYDGMDFHRVVSGLLIQSGDPTDTGAGGESSTGEPIPNEFSDQLHNFTGALCMAGGSEGNRSQYYVVAANSLSDDMVQRMEQAGVDSGLIAAYKLAYGAPHLDFRYTVIGQVYEGLDIVISISRAGTDDQHRPNRAITVDSVRIESYSEPAE